MTTTTAADSKKITVSVGIDDSPSKSKGWGRYQLSDGINDIVESRTGNPWVSAPHSGLAYEGSELTLTMQVQLNIGRCRRRETTAIEVELIAREGGTCTVEHKPGSQGLRLTIAGAVLATEVES